MENHLDKIPVSFEIILPGETEIIEVTSEPVFETSEVPAIACDCPTCSAVKNRKRTIVKSRPDDFYGQSFNTPVKTFISQTVRAIEYENASAKDEQQDNIELMKVCLEKLNRLSTESESLAVSELNDLQQEITTYTKTVSRLSSQINDCIKIKSNYTVSQVRDELYSIINDERVLSVSQQDTCISVFLKEIEMENTMIGPLEIRFPPVGTPLFYRTEETNLSRNGYIHPHINTAGQLCWGTAEELREKVFHTTSLFVRFDIVTNLLSKYNPDSPYESIDKWAPRFCANCDCSLNKIEHSQCTCGTYLCNDCYSSFRTKCCDIQACPNCASTCDACQSAVCHSCLINSESDLYTSCDECCKTGCVVCIRSCSTCLDTRHRMCQDCQWYCKKCDRFECTSCANVKKRKDGLYEYRCKKNHRNILNKNVEDRIQPIQPTEAVETVERPRIRVLPAE